MSDLLMAAALALAATWAISRFLSPGLSEEAARKLKKVSGQEARALSERGVPLLAVFSQAEFNQSHIPGSLNIPVGELPARLSELEGKDEIVVYCASGMRSARAARLLAQSGKTVYDLGPMGAY